MSIAEKLTTIAENQQAVYDAGYNSGAELADQEYGHGYNDGYQVGLNEGHDEGYEQGHLSGKQAEYDRFWDVYQSNGSRTDYRYAFGGHGWTAETLKPKYKVSAANAAQMFNYCKAEIDLRTLGVSFDFSKSINFYGFASYSSILAFGEIIATSAGGLSEMFNQCKKLHTIEKLQVSSSANFSSAFSGTSALENLTITGTIGTSSLNVSACTLLTHDSLMSIINALQNKTGTGTWTVTLGATNLAKLTDAEKAIATQKGWTLA